MAKSRMTAGLIGCLAAATAAPAQTLTAEQAMANYRDAFSPVSKLDCPESEDPEEIVVCGRAPGASDPNRLPLPVEPLPGDPVAGEALSAVEVVNTKERCSPVGPNNGCGGALPIFPIIGVAVKAVQALVDGE